MLSVETKVECLLALATPKPLLREHLERAGSGGSLCKAIAALKREGLLFTARMYKAGDGGAMKVLYWLREADRDAWVRENAVQHAPKPRRRSVAPKKMRAAPVSYERSSTAQGQPRP